MITAKRPPIRPRIPAIDRFWLKVDKTDGCWFWTGCIGQTGGYGKFWDGERYLYAHRYSYEHFVGPVAPGLQLDHLCRVRHCVNPDHLEQVTNQENHLRIPVELRRKTHCFRGHELTPANRINGKGQCKICHAFISRQNYAKARGRA